MDIFKEEELVLYFKDLDVVVFCLGGWVFLFGWIFSIFYIDFMKSIVGVMRRSGVKRFIVVLVWGIVGIIFVRLLVRDNECYVFFYWLWGE